MGLTCLCRMANPRCFSTGRMARKTIFIQSSNNEGSRPRRQRGTTAWVAPPAKRAAKARTLRKAVAHNENPKCQGFQRSLGFPVPATSPPQLKKGHFLQAVRPRLTTGKHLAPHTISTPSRSCTCHPGHLLDRVTALVRVRLRSVRMLCPSKSCQLILSSRSSLTERQVWQRCLINSDVWRAERPTSFCHVSSHGTSMTR